MRLLNKKTLIKLKEPKILVSIFLAAIMILSTLGFILDSQSGGNSKLEYKGYKFEQMYDGIQTKINGQKFIFNYFPEQLERINISYKVKSLLKDASVLSITYDPNSEYKEVFAEQQFNLQEKLSEIEKYIIPGLTNNTDFEQIPQINCKNATNAIPVIFFEESITTNITMKNNCITIQIGNMNDVYQVGDLLFYQMAGIME